jgi:hypothetical protein
VLELLRAALPIALLAKTSVTLTEFGSQQVLTHCSNSIGSSSSAKSTGGSNRDADGIDTAAAAAAAAAISSSDSLNLC